MLSSFFIFFQSIKNLNSKGINLFQVEITLLFIYLTMLKLSLCLSTIMDSTYERVPKIIIKT